MRAHNPCNHVSTIRHRSGEGERTTDRAAVVERLGYPPQVGGPASDGSAAQRQEAPPTVVRAADAQRAGMLRRAAAQSRLLTSRRNLVNGVGRCGGDGRPRPGVIGRHRWPTEIASGAVASISCVRTAGAGGRAATASVLTGRVGASPVRLWGWSQGPPLRTEGGAVLTPLIGAGRRSCAVLSRRGPLSRGAPTPTCWHGSKGPSRQQVHSAAACPGRGAG
jgi:hypothetical protein